MSKISITGVRGLEENLKKLHAAHARNVLRKTLKEAAVPLIERAAAAAPVDSGTLRDGIGGGTRLNKTQGRQQRREVGKHAADYFVGSPSSRAHLAEFGSEHHAPQPFLAPAWDASKDQMLEDIKRKLWENTTKSLKKKGIAMTGGPED